MRTTWVIQENLNRDDKELLPILDKFQIPYQTITIIPFSDSIPDVAATGPIIVRGSTTTLKNAEKKGWNPGVWHNENFKPSHYKELFGKDFLNHEGKVVTAEQLVGLSEWSTVQHLFVRPNSDYKEFTGQTMTMRDAKKLVKGIGMNGYPFDANSEFFVAPAIKIESEYRLVVVNGKVVSGTSYRVYGKRKHVSAPDHILGFGQRIAASLAEVYCLDIGETREKQLGVVECNCFNASGLYGDIENIVRQVTDFVEKTY